MSHYLDEERAVHQPEGMIKIQFDLNRTLREQIKSAVAAVLPRACERHPHEQRYVDLPAMVAAALYHDAGTMQHRLGSTFKQLYDRCSNCPRNQTGPEIEVDKCAAPLPPPFNLSWCNRDKQGLLLPRQVADPNLDPDRCVNDQLTEWVSKLPGFKCELTNESLKRREIIVEPDIKTLTFWPLYKACLACRLERLGVPPINSYASFDNLIIDPPVLKSYLEICQFYATAPQGLLLLLGNVGTAKTHLSVAILREMFRRGTTGMVFAQHRDFVSRHRQAMRPVAFGVKQPESPLRACQRAAVLVYDDLTATTDTGPVGEDLFMDLFEYRIAHFMPTIITSNLPRPGLEAVLGSRLYDRFFQATSAVLEFGFPSKRRLFNEAYLNRHRPIGQP